MNQSRKSDSSLFTEFRDRSIMLLMLVFMFSAALSAHQSTHWVEQVSPNGKCIAIEDQSVWLIAPNTRHISQKWQKNDELVIYPNVDLFSNETFPFYICNNTRSGSVVSAVLQLGPEKACDHTTWIDEVDVSKGHVILVDRDEAMSHWDVDEQDRDRFLNWESDHGIIIGNNDGLLSWWYSNCKHVLINVNCREWIRVTKRVQ